MARARLLALASPCRRATAIMAVGARQDAPAAQPEGAPAAPPEAAPAAPPEAAPAAARAPRLHFPYLNTLMLFENYSHTI